MDQKRGPWTVTGTNTAFENTWLTVQVDTVIMPDGSPGTYTVADSGQGAVIVPLDADGNVYLAREYRYGIDKVVLEACAGGMERGEAPLTAAKRELEEEAGITAENWTYFGGFSILSSKMKNLDHLFLAEGLTFGPQKLESTESIEVVKMPLQEALGLVDSGEIVSLQTAALLLRVERVLAERRSEGA